MLATDKGNREVLPSLAEQKASPRVISLCKENLQQQLTSQDDQVSAPEQVK